jgi:hypothetical protein
MNEVSVRQKESAALATLQRALEKYSQKQEMSYEDALLRFSRSGTYKELFDFDSLLWTQGPDYLISVYEAEEGVI